jgi:hypothetical protein
MVEAKQENKFDFETLVLLIGTNPLPNYWRLETHEGR